MAWYKILEATAPVLSGTNTKPHQPNTERGVNSSVDAGSLTQTPGRIWKVDPLIGDPNF